jgi:hypothetical protein
MPVEIASHMPAARGTRPEDPRWSSSGCECGGWIEPRRVRGGREERGSGRDAGRGVKQERRNLIEPCGRAATVAKRTSPRDGSARGLARAIKANKMKRALAIEWPQPGHPPVLAETDPCQRPSSRRYHFSCLKLKPRDPSREAPALRGAGPGCAFARSLRGLPRGSIPIDPATAPLSGAVSARTNPGLSGARGRLNVDFDRGSYPWTRPQRTPTSPETGCAPTAACLSATNPGAAASKLPDRSMMRQLRILFRRSAAALLRCFVLRSATAPSAASALEVPPSDTVPLHPACQSDPWREPDRQLVVTQRSGLVGPGDISDRNAAFARASSKSLKSARGVDRATACAQRGWSL